MQRTTLPFRADHVGSLLRPAALKEARGKREKGEIGDAELQAIEDREIEKVIRKQEDIGLKSITDGEFRRAFWNYDFLGQLEGVGSLPRRAQDRVPGPPAPADDAACHRQARRLPAASDDRPLQVRRRVTPRATPKMTIPSPSSLHFRYGRDAVPAAIYPDDGPFLPRSRRKLPQGGARVRRRRLPLPAARRGQLHLSVRSQAARAW